MRELPTGTVTLLFTDVEGSTRLLRRLGDAYVDAMADHRRILRESFERHGGREIDSQGDGLFVVFRRASEAVTAAVDGQRALAAHGWPDGASLRVRMGLHTAEPTVAEDRYVGLGVHRAARICAAGHGGQVLVSSATQALLADDEPDDVSLRPLGERILKDFERPELLFEVVAAGLVSREPRAADHQVPGPFDGNEEQLAAAAQEAVARTRVVVADDSLLMRQGIRRVLEGAGFDVTGEAGDGEELMRLVEAEPPDVVITDIRMPPTQTDEGLLAAQAIRARWPAVSVLVLSQYVEPSVACDLLRERPDGAGYLLKDRVADLGDFAEAVRRVARGGTALDPAVVTLLIGRPRLEDPLAALDDRQRELLALVAQGLDDEEIAEQVGLSPRAVGIVVGEAISTLSLSAAAGGKRRVRELLTLLQTP